MSQPTQFKRCNCSAASTAATPIQQTAPPYQPPTHALILQLANFPLPSADSAPQLWTLLSQSTSMELKWHEDSCGNGHTATTTQRSISTVLRLLGLHELEHNARILRAQQLHQTQLASGVTASPAAVYPPPFGRALMELATNHLGVYEAVKSQFEEMKKTQTANTVQHLNNFVFLEPQVAAIERSATSATSSSASSADSPFPLHSRPTLQSFSSIPLTNEAQRTNYIQCIVRHVAARLNLDIISCSTRPSTTSSTSATNPTHTGPHILLLHLDAIELFGVSNFPPAMALQFLDQLLVALMSQLSTKPAPLPSMMTTAMTTDSYPPLPMRLLQPPQSSSASLSSSPMNMSVPSCDDHGHLSSPLHAAALLLSASTRSCSNLLWSVILEELSPTMAQPSLALESKSSTLDSASQTLLGALRPIQSYQVQDGVIDMRTHGWSSCCGYIWHSNSTRIPTQPISNSSPPLHGSLHLMHFLKELVFKLGLGSKYGA